MVRLDVVQSVFLLQEAAGDGAGDGATHWPLALQAVVPVVWQSLAFEHAAHVPLTHPFGAAQSSPVVQPAGGAAGATHWPPLHWDRPGVLQSASVLQPRLR